MSVASALVTGASGFIGAHLVARLLSEGVQVTVLARSSSLLPAEWRERVRVVASDDFGESNLRRLLNAPVETVFHLAAYGVKPDQRDIDQMLRINVELAATLVRLCAEWRARMVMAGTFSEYRSPSSSGSALGEFAIGAGQALWLVKGRRRFDGKRDRPQQRRRVSLVASLQGLWRR